MKSNLTNRTLHALIWSFSGTGVQVFSQITVLLVLARFLGPAEFGVASLALVIIAFSEIFTQMGVGPALVQRPVLTPIHISTGRALALATGVLFGGGLWLAAPLLEYYFASPGLDQLLRALSPVFVIQGIAIASESLLQRELQFRTIAKITAFSQVVGYVGVSMTCAWLGFGVWSIIFAHLAKSLLRSGLMLASSSARGLSLDWSATKELLNFGAGFSLAKIFNFIAVQGDNLIVAKLLGPTALGYYGRAYYFIETSASFVGNSIDQVLFPSLAKVQNNQERAARAYQRVLMLISAVFIPGSIFLALYAHWVIPVLLGDGWEPVILPLRILAIGIAMRAGYRISDSLARAMGAVYRRAWRQAIYAGLALLGAWGGHFWGIEGVALGISLALVANYLMMLQLGRSLVGAKWSSLLAAHAPGIVLGTLTLAVGIPVSMVLDRQAFQPLVSLLVATMVFASTYFAAVALVIKLLPPADREWLLQLVGSKLGTLQRRLTRKGSPE